MTKDMISRHRKAVFKNTTKYKKHTSETQQLRTTRPRASQKHPERPLGLPSVLLERSGGVKGSFPNGPEAEKKGTSKKGDR